MSGDEWGWVGMSGGRQVIFHDFYTFQIIQILKIHSKNHYLRG